MTRRMINKTLLIAGILVLLVIPLIAYGSYMEARKIVDDAVKLFIELGYNVNTDYQHGFLQEGKSEYLETVFYRNNSYVIIVGGDINAQDIDVSLYNYEWAKVAKDDDRGQKAVVEIAPAKTGPHKIKITLKRGKEEGAHWCYALGYK